MARGDDQPDSRGRFEGAARGAFVGALLGSLLGGAVIAGGLADGQPLAWAQATASGPPAETPAETVVRVVNTDGSSLNLRAGASTDDQVLARLADGSTLTVTGPSKQVGDIRWLPVRDGSGRTGWVNAQYTAVVSVPTLTPMPTEVVAEAPPVAAPAPEPTATPTPIPLPVEVEARLKFPETSGREQEITVWVMRSGAPVPGALVTVIDDEGEAPFDRPVQPTDETGRARHTFDIRHEKGTVNFVVKAMAPDGGAGETTVSYFRR